MDEQHEPTPRSHWGCVTAFVVPVLALTAFLVWLLDRLSSWSILPR